MEICDSGGCTNDERRERSKRYSRKDNRKERDRGLDPVRELDALPLGRGSHNRQPDQRPERRQGAMSEAEADGNPCRDDDQSNA